MRRRLAFVLALAALPASAQTDSGRVLVPLTLPTPVTGAFGSFWTTDTLLFNDGGAAARILPGLDLEPRATLRLENVTSETPTRARMLVLDRAVRIAACLHQGVGSEQCIPLPVARESAFSTRVVLPFVPLRAGTRAALRIYGDDGAARTAVLRLCRLDRLDPLVEETITLAPDAEVSFFAVTDLLQRWPQLQVAASVRVEIQSLDARRLWAFASSTDNTAETVGIFAPQ